MDKAEYVFEKIAKKKNTAFEKTMINLGAGAVAGGISGFAVAPLATVADIAGTQTRDASSAFYKMNPLQVAKKLYQEGKNSAIRESKILTAQGKPFKIADKGIGILGGIKAFYGGQGVKALKIAPQNAINLAIFTGLSAALANALLKKKN